MSCLFCDLAQTPYTRVNPEDQVMAESPFFYVKPGLGHFREGYLLINSRIHARSLSYLNRDVLRELQEVKRIMASRLRDLLGNEVVFFEHGEVNPKHHPGCCLEHAHLHILPLPEGADETMELTFSREKLKDLTDLRDYATRNTSYLYYENREGMFAYCVGENLPSQFLRRMFCQRLGVEDQWDWAVFPFRDKISSFLETYQKHAQLRQWQYNLIPCAHP